MMKDIYMGTYHFLTHKADFVYIKDFSKHMYKNFSDLTLPMQITEYSRQSTSVASNHAYDALLLHITR